MLHAASRRKNREKLPQEKRPLSWRRCAIALLWAAVGLIIAFQAGRSLLALNRPSLSVSAQSASQVRSLPALEEDTRMDVNAASAEDLQKVPGIGPALSQAILECREAAGGFRFLEEIKDVPGIGEKRFEALKELFFCPFPGQP